MTIVAGCQKGLLPIKLATQKKKKKKITQTKSKTIKTMLHILSQN